MDDHKQAKSATFPSEVNWIPEILEVHCMDRNGNKKGISKSNPNTRPHRKKSP
jgi:hypothetical protein